MNERLAGDALTDWNQAADADTVALLQEEIGRLEAELLARDEALLHPFAAPEAPAPESHGPLVRKLDELTAELASREETINLLLEQTLLFEDAAVAQRAEWEQLNRWVEEVERRVEGRLPPAAALDAERARAEAVQRQWDSDRIDWAARFEGLEREAAHLRALLDGRGDNGPLMAVEEENRRLRASYIELQRLAKRADEAEELRDRLTVAVAELALSRASVTALDDDHRRERNEREAEVTALRGKLARESLQPSGPPPEAGASGLDADERIRAFRQHLKEVHEREAEERGKMSFSSRLSRLWRNTGPGG